MPEAEALRLSSAKVRRVLCHGQCSTPQAQAAQVEGGEAPQDGQTQAGQEGQTQEGQTEGEAPKEPNSEEPLKAGSALHTRVSQG